MAEQAAVIITGIAEIRAKLAPERLREVLQQAIAEALVPVVMATRARAPRGKTGKLATTIRAVVGKRGGPSTSAVILSGTGYGHLVEYGHRQVAHSQKGELFSITTVSIRGASRGLNLGQRVSVRRGRLGGVAGNVIGEVAPHPFARPAFEAHEQEMTRIIEERLVAAINAP